MNPIELAKEWVNDPYYAQSDREELLKLIEEGNESELTDRFYKDLEFGTGGIRGVLGVGTNRMNIYNVRRAGQALANVIKKESPKNLTVAISYDSRRMSFEFAKESASLFAANGIVAYIFKRLSPVAYLSFSVRHHKACAGVMITASHNPPQYNGYKVYWNDGCQVTPPYDEAIILEYEKLKNQECLTMDFDEGIKKGLILWMGDELENAYQKAILSWAIFPQLAKENSDKISLVYTALHGTGLIPCTSALRNLNLTNIYTVKEQDLPDGNFPTVKLPNPEDPAALEMAIDLMLEKNADIAVGTDPDADRLGIAVNHRGVVKILNGHQIGALMMEYILLGLKNQNRLEKDTYVVKTIVTSRLQDAIAKNYGVTCYNTLTGFKWICSKLRELETSNPMAKFVFGTEESFGYLNHNEVRDKDAVSSVSLLAEMTLFYKLKGLTLIDALEELFKRYGYYGEQLLNMNYYGKEGAAKILRIMNTLRTNPPKSLAQTEVVQIDDIKISESKDLKTKEITPIDLPKSNVLCFVLASGERIYARPSGTEPKIKFYTLLKDKDQKTLDERSAIILEELTHICENA